jgi:potassium channel subfamily K
MNDPGLDDPIATAASRVQEKHDEVARSDVGEEEEEMSLFLPARWWWASTALPLIAGTFGPMANAFSICALVDNWRVKIPKGGTEEHGIDIPDPKW